MAAAPAAAIAIAIIVVSGGNGGTNGSNGSGNLPTTGSDLNGYGLVGAGLLTVGGLFLLGARKRRSNATA